MAVNWRVVWRKAHRVGAIVCALPFLVVVVTGLLLQVKKQVPWVQPPTMKAKKLETLATWDVFLETAKGVPEAEIKTWADVERIDIQPPKGIAKIQAKNRWEVQVNLHTGELLHSAYRRSDLIESFHDGSWFHDNVKLWVFLPSGVIVLGLWFTGMYLYVLPWWVKFRKTKPKTGLSPPG